VPTKNDGNTAPAPETGTRFSAEEIHENVLVQAEDEMKRPASDLFWSAVTAGLTIGWSFVGGAYVSTLVGPEYRKAAQAALYPLGFILVIIGRSQLFTENTLEPVIPVLDHPTGDKLAKMFRLWGLVLLGNMFGAAAFALLFAHTNVVPEAVSSQMREMSAKAMEGSFGMQFYHAIFAGWLIALTAWLVQSYLEQDLDVHIVLRPAPRKAALAVGGAGAARLGWTSWLGAACAASVDAKACAPLAPARFTLRMPPSAAAWRPSNA